ncbi:Exonuclease SbcD [Lachnospiraceae bacterium TWA4]|nr:Exonuclease SbcD [Lachnospiraceae bacterium TWA4]
MKFIHTGDVHLGAKPDKGRPWSKEREDAIWDSFGKVVEAAKDVDFLLIAGDLFHAQPTQKERDKVNDLFASIAPIPVILIAGNHDYLDSKKTIYSWTDNVYVLDGEEMEGYILPDLSVCVYGLSYHNYEITSPLYNEIEIEPNEKFSILLGHGGDAKHIPIHYKELSVKGGYDYIALGHLHKHQILYPNLAYCGSLEPLDYTEVGPHGYILGEISKDGRLKLQFKETAKTQYKRISVFIEEDSTYEEICNYIGQMVKKQGQENIYHLVFRGNQPKNFSLELASFEDLGKIVAITNKCEESVDYFKLYKEHEGDLLGDYLEEFADVIKIKPKDRLDRVRKKALLYGVNALLESMEVDH